jgi:ribosomal-protein-alanine N-acetyltransferase
VARAQQMQLILLEVRVSNEAAIRLYQRYGFSEIGRRKHYYPVAPGVREDAIVMQLLL